MSVASALAVICLPLILLSLEADAQPTTCDATSCSFSTLDEIAKEIKDEIRHQINDVKNLLALDPSKQALVSALICEHFKFHVFIRLTRSCQ